MYKVFYNTEENLTPSMLNLNNIYTKSKKPKKKKKRKKDSEQSIKSDISTVI